MKRLISVCLAVLMLCAVLVPSAAFAKSATPAWDKYSKNGTHKVSTFTFTVEGNDFTYKVWYPKDIADMSARPVILYCNGTGSNYEKSPDTADFLKKAASHGFICLTNTDQNTGTGVSMDAGMTALLGYNKKTGHKLCGKVKTGKVGIAGHSQGATCCMNLASKGKYENGKYYKAIFACSLPTPQLAASPLQNCPYDATLVSIPTLLVAGSGPTDSKIICPMETSLQPAFSRIKNDVYLARMTGVEHADSIGKTHPYMLAWFAYKLQGDSAASKAFVGKSPELKTNPAWQDFKRKIYVKKPALVKVTAKSKAFGAKWNKTSGVKGYQLQYSTGKKFAKKYTKSVWVKKQGTTSKTVKKLKAKKTYYVRVRSYRTVGGIKYYSKWSAVKKVKTK